MVKMNKKARLTNRAKTAASKTSITKREAARKQNSTFRTRFALTYSGGTKRDSDTVTLREVNEPGLRELFVLPPSKIRALLVQHGVLPGSKEQVQVSCWLCQHKMMPEGQGLRCRNKGCSQRPRLLQPRLAYTPFFGYVTAGLETQETETMCVLTAWCIGMKISNDQCAQMLKKQGENYNTLRNTVNGWYKKHKVALAYSEQLHARTTVFERDVLEADTARFGTRKEDHARVHQGRLMVCKARLKKTWTTTALPPSRSTGKRGMPPETAAEVEPVLARSTGKAIVLAPDGGAAWRNTAKTTPTLKGVAHGRGLFTPPAQLKKSTLDASVTAMLRQRGKGPERLTKETQRHFTLPAGDNTAEGVFGTVKHSMRRLQSTGKRTSDKMRAIQAQSAAALTRNSGMAAVLHAHKTFRKDGLQGKLGITARDAYNVEKCTWLWKDDI